MKISHLRPANLLMKMSCSLFLAVTALTVTTVVASETVEAAGWRPIDNSANSLRLPVTIVRLAEALRIDEHIPLNSPAHQMAYEPWGALGWCSIENPDSFVKATEGPVAVSNGDYSMESFHKQTTLSNPATVRNATVLLDFGEAVSGHFVLDLEGKAATVDVGYSSLLYGGRTLPAHALEGVHPGGGLRCVYDGPNRMVWESVASVPFRYVQLTFRDLDGPLNLHRFGLREAPADPVVTGLRKKVKPVFTFQRQPGSQAGKRMSSDTHRTIEYWPGADSQPGAVCDFSDAVMVGGGTLLRQEFVIPDKPQKALLHLASLTKNQRFRIFLNGRFVGDGPQRGYDTYYTSWEVSDFLIDGANVLAIDRMDKRGRMIWSLRAGETVLARSDNSVAVAENPARALSKSISTFGTLNEFYDCRFEHTGWQLPAFDTKGWKSAQVAPLDSPIVPNPVEAMGFRFHRPERVLQLGEVLPIELADVGGYPSLQMACEPIRALRANAVENPEGFVSATHGPVQVRNAGDATDDKDNPRSLATTVVLDLGRSMNGSFHLDVEGNDGATVDIGFGNILLGDRVPVIYRGGMSKVGKKINRVILREGRNTWTGFNWDLIRYVQLTFRNLDGPLTVHDFGVIEREPPLSLSGTFACSDPTLTNLWTATELTTRLSIQDMSMDNTEREKAMWTGECASRNLFTSWVAYDNTRVMRHFYRQITRDPEDDEMRFYLTSALPISCVPFDKGRGFWFFHGFQSWYALGKYRNYSTSEAYAEDNVLPAFRAAIAYYRSLLNENGLIGKHPGKPWLDWVPGDYGGEGAPQNLFFALILRAYADAEESAGNAAAVREARKQADGICQTIYDHFWIEEVGLYACNRKNGQPATRLYTEHVQALALLAGLGGDGRAERIAKAIADPHNPIIETDLAFTHFLGEALFEAGYAQLAIDILRERFGPILHWQSNPAFPERRSAFAALYAFTNKPWVASRKWLAEYSCMAQSASAVPAWLLSTYVLGIRPLEPGFARFEIDPHTCDLIWAEGTMPSPAGPIPARWEQKDNTFTIQVTVPEGTEAVVHLPPGDTYRIDGKVGAPDGGSGDSATFVLPAGEHLCQTLNTYSRSAER